MNTELVIIETLGGTWRPGYFNTAWQRLIGALHVMAHVAPNSELFDDLRMLADIAATLECAEICAQATFARP
jgi:hypothetical protein